jgi:hypothetical protein
MMVRFTGDEPGRQHRHEALGASGIGDSYTTPAMEMPWLSRLVEDDSA